MHVTARDRHYAVLSIVTALLGPIGARTHLDRGCGTGTALAREMDRAVFRVVDPPAD